MSIAATTCLSTFCALGATIAAWHQVGAANNQVKAALEAVDRTERLKILSDYTAAAHAYCQTIVPKELRRNMRILLSTRKDRTIAPEDAYILMQSADMTKEKINTLVSNSMDLSGNAELELLNKAQIFSIWIDDADRRNDFMSFNYSLPFELAPNTSRDQQFNAAQIATRFGRCKFKVNEKIREYARG